MLNFKPLATTFSTVALAKVEHLGTGNLSYLILSFLFGNFPRLALLPPWGKVGKGVLTL